MFLQHLMKLSFIFIVNFIFIACQISAEPLRKHDSLSDLAIRTRVSRALDKRVTPILDLFKNVPFHQNVQTGQLKNFGLNVRASSLYGTSDLVGCTAVFAFNGKNLTIYHIKQDGKEKNQMTNAQIVDDYIIEYLHTRIPSKLYAGSVTQVVFMHSYRSQPGLDMVRDYFKETQHVPDENFHRVFYNAQSPIADLTDKPLGKIVAQWTAKPNNGGATMTVYVEDKVPMSWEYDANGCQVAGGNQKRGMGTCAAARSAKNPTGTKAISQPTASITGKTTGTATGNPTGKPTGTATGKTTETANGIATSKTTGKTTGTANGIATVKTTGKTTGKTTAIATAKSTGKPTTMSKTTRKATAATSTKTTAKPSRQDTMKPGATQIKTKKP